MRIYPDIRADNKFKMPYLFIKVFFFKSSVDHQLETIKIFRPHLDYTIHLTSGKVKVVKIKILTRHRK